MADQGTFIVLEGADGSGKGTQFRLLAERLKAVGYEVEVFDFPRYDQESSYFVRQYLNGKYGPAAKVSPYTASLFYALDRYEAAPAIRKALADGKVVLCNRYVGSNMAHMGSKIADPIEQRSFFVWEDSLEFQLLGLPRPNLNIFLHVPAEVSYELIAKKNTRAYTSKARDEHEADMDHLKSTVATYELLCRLFPVDFVSVDCMMGNKLLDVPEINNRIWQLVKPYLPANHSGEAHRVTLKLNESQTAKPAKAKTEVSEPDSYDFGLVSLELLGQVETFDNSCVQYQLDWSASGYKYREPDGLGKKTLAVYQRLLNEIANHHKKNTLNDKSKASRQIWRAAVPSAALMPAKFSLSSNGAEKLCAYLRGISSPEAKMLADKIRSSLRLKNALGTGGDNAAQPKPLGEIISKLAKDNLAGGLSGQTEPITLIEATPRNEFKLLADIVYPFSNLSLAEVENTIDSWNYQQKFDTLQAAILDNSKALAEVKYRFDLVVDRLTLRMLLEVGIGKEINAQPATPRFGYDVPADMKPEAEDNFIDCFDKSLELYSLLQTEAPKAAPLAVLAGHRLRLNALISLDRLQALKASQKLPKWLTTGLAEAVSQVHPVIGGSFEHQPKAKSRKTTEPTAKRTKS